MAPPSKRTKPNKDTDIISDDLSEDEEPKDMAKPSSFQPQESQEPLSQTKKRNSIIADLEKPKAPSNRLVISHMELEDFKSYRGVQKIGPFHQVNPKDTFDLD